MKVEGNSQVVIDQGFHKRFRHSYKFFVPFVLDVRLRGHEGLRFDVDLQAFWDEIFLKALFEEVLVVVCLYELATEPVIALPQLEKLFHVVSGSRRGGFRAGISVSVSGRHSS